MQDSRRMCKAGYLPLVCANRRRKNIFRAAILCACGQKTFGPAYFLCCTVPVDYRTECTGVQKGIRRQWISVGAPYGCGAGYREPRNSPPAGTLAGSAGDMYNYGTDAANPVLQQATECAPHGSTGKFYLGVWRNTVPAHLPYILVQPGGKFLGVLFGVRCCFVYGNTASAKRSSKPFAVCIAGGPGPGLPAALCAVPEDKDWSARNRKWISGRRTRRICTEQARREWQHFDHLEYPFGGRKGVWGFETMPAGTYTTLLPDHAPVCKAPCRCYRRS